MPFEVTLANACSLLSEAKLHCRVTVAMAVTVVPLLLPLTCDSSLPVVLPESMATTRPSRVPMPVLLATALRLTLLNMVSTTQSPISDVVMSPLLPIAMLWLSLRLTQAVDYALLHRVSPALSIRPMVVICALSGLGLPGVVGVGMVAILVDWSVVTWIHYYDRSFYWNLSALLLSFV